MRGYEKLYGVTALPYCIMLNHFHILVEVPKRPEALPAIMGARGIDQKEARTARWRTLAAEFKRVLKAQGGEREQSLEIRELKAR